MAIKSIKKETIDNKTVHPLWSSRLMASVSSAILETLTFHPFDTAARRVMASSEILSNKQDIKRIILTKNYSYTSLYRGSFYAAIYRIQQRTFHFLVQPITTLYLHDYLKDKLSSTCSLSTSIALTNGISGAIVGAAEGLIAPFDILRLKKQTNIRVFKYRNLYTILKQEKLRSLYKGVSWTIARNVPGAFTLFSTISYVKSSIFGLDNIQQRANIKQNFIASTIGAITTLLIANPIDVIKVRVQNKPFNANISGISIIKELIQKEGILAFYKGFTIKLSLIAPRLIFTYTIATYLTQYFHQLNI